MASLFDLSGKRVVLTGGLGFLGKTFAKSLAESGATVVVSDLDGAACAAFASELKKSVQPASANAVIHEGHGVDLSSEKSVVAWAKSVMSAGPVDVLINNAHAKTSRYFEPLETYPLEDWNQILSVNLTGMFLAAQSIGPRMAERGSGNIINLSSIYGVVGPDQRIYEGSFHEELKQRMNTPAVYSASKGAVLALTRHLATFWGSRGVRVNSLTPGGVAGAQNEVFQRNYGSRVPMGRMATPQEIAGPLVFLASDASSYMNGHNLVVDGGWTAW